MYVYIYKLGNESISHLGKRKIIESKVPLEGICVSFLESKGLLDLQDFVHQHSSFPPFYTQDKMLHA